MAGSRVKVKLDAAASAGKKPQAQPQKSHQPKGKAKARSKPTENVEVFAGKVDTTVEEQLEVSELLEDDLPSAEESTFLDSILDLLAFFLQDITEVRPEIVMRDKHIAMDFCMCHTAQLTLDSSEPTTYNTWTSLRQALGKFIRTNHGRSPKILEAEEIKDEDKGEDEDNMSDT